MIYFPSPTVPGGNALSGLLRLIASNDVPGDIWPHAFSPHGTITSGFDTNGQLCRKWLVPIGCVLQMTQGRTALGGKDMAIRFWQAF